MLAIAERPAPSSLFRRSFSARLVHLNHLFFFGNNHELQNLPPWTLLSVVWYISLWEFINVVAASNDQLSVTLLDFEKVQKVVPSWVIGTEKLGTISGRFGLAPRKSLAATTAFDNFLPVSFCKSSSLEAVHSWGFDH
jgi:hypothetical protein